jgi:hypothetical protein
MLCSLNTNRTVNQLTQKIPWLAVMNLQQGAGQYKDFQVHSCSTLNWHNLALDRSLNLQCTDSIMQLMVIR